MSISSPVLSGVPTVDDVIALLASIGVELPPSADAQLALDAAIARAGHSTGREYGRVTEARLESGTCMSVLDIDSCRSITEVAVSSDWRTAADPTYTVLDPSAYRAIPTDREQKEALQRLDGALWTNGLGNLRITATWGADMPADLYQAVVYDAAATLYAGTFGQSGGPIKRYTEGEVTVEYADALQVLAAGQARFAHAYRADVRYDVL